MFDRIAIFASTLVILKLQFRENLFAYIHVHKVVFMRRTHDASKGARLIELKSGLQIFVLILFDCHECGLASLRLAS